MEAVRVVEAVRRGGGGNDIIEGGGGIAIPANTLIYMNGNYLSQTTSNGDQGVQYQYMQCYLRCLEVEGNSVEVALGEVE